MYIYGNKNKIEIFLTSMNVHTYYLYCKTTIYNSKLLL